MPRFDDTPKHKRDARWDPVAQKLVPLRRRPKRRSGESRQKDASARVVQDAKSDAWRFGENQTPAEELREIRDAQARGLEQEYATRQRWARMRAAETERKREVKRSKAA